MFPLAHYYVNEQIYGNPSPLLALGALWPDLAAGCFPIAQRRLQRDSAHEMGLDFYAWCQKHFPQHIEIALGVISHGINPGCVDYFADEYWPGYHKGRCFQLGEAYIDQVQAATGLEHQNCWWKAHNFVEMGYELMIEHRQPKTKLGLLAALNDEQAALTAAKVLSAYAKADPQLILAVFHSVPQAFSIIDITPVDLCVKQSASLAQRFTVYNADIPAMVALLEKVNHDVETLDDDFLGELVSRTAAELSAF